MTYFYIYKITCTKGRWKNHYYIGQHKTTKMDDGYKGSSVILNKSYYPKHPNDYIKEILCFCNDADELNAAEYFYIGDKYETDPLCVNLKAGGNQAGFSDETRQKISERNKGKTRSDETRQKISEARKGNNNPMYGKTPWNKSKTPSDETRKKQSEAHKGKTPGNKGKQGLQVAWNKGKQGLQVAWNKGSKGRHWYNNGTIQLQAFECPVGYVAGRLR